MHFPRYVQPQLSNCSRLYENRSVAIIVVCSPLLFSRTSVLASPENAFNVELCNCPPQYKGSFCEQCAEGYTRSTPNGGPYVTCVPCQCYGHSNSCDPETGVCHNCTHNTTGNIGSIYRVNIARFIMVCLPHLSVFVYFRFVLIVALILKRRCSFLRYSLFYEAELKLFLSILRKKI